MSRPHSHVRGLRPRPAGGTPAEATARGGRPRRGRAAKRGIMGAGGGLGLRPHRLQARRRRPAPAAGRKGDVREGSSDEAPPVPEHRRGCRCGRRGGRRLRAGRLAGVAGAQARHVVHGQLPGARHFRGPRRPAHHRRHRRPAHRAPLQRGRAGPRVRGARRGLGRLRGDVLLAGVLLLGANPRAQLLRLGPVRDDLPRGMGLARVRRRLRAVARHPRRLRDDPVRRPRLRGRDGRMGQPEDQEPRRFPGPPVPHAGPRRGRAARPRGGRGQPSLLADPAGPSLRRSRRRRVVRAVARPPVRVPPGGQALPLAGVPRAGDDGELCR